MRDFVFELSGPPGVILVGALITAFGVYWASVKQADSRKRNEANATAQTGLLQDIAARGGNKKELEELIRARSQALTSDPARARDIAEGIINKIPKLADNLVALEKSKQEVAEQHVREFRLNWEPLIRWTIQRIDLLAKQLQEKGVKIETSGRDNFELTTFWGPAQPEVRKINISGKAPGATSSLVVYYVPINLSPEQAANSAAEITIGGMGEFQLRISMEEAECTWRDPTTNQSQARKLAAPKDGKIPADFSDFVEDAIARAFERRLVAVAVESPDAWRYRPPR